MGCAQILYSQLPYHGFGLGEAVEFAYIEQLEVGTHIGSDDDSMAHAEIEIDDGEPVGPCVHQGKE